MFDSFLFASAAFFSVFKVSPRPRSRDGTRASLDRFPGFSRDRFPGFSETDSPGFQRQIPPGFQRQIPRVSLQVSGAASEMSGQDLARFQGQSPTFQSKISHRDSGAAPGIPFALHEATMSTAAQVPPLQLLQCPHRRAHLPLPQLLQTL